jgi:hypothetical protein
MYDSFNISFDANQAKNGKEYIINMIVKNSDEVEENFIKKTANKEETTSEEFALYILSKFESKIFMDKNTLLANTIQIKFAEEAIYKSVSKSDEYKDKSEEERRKIAKELANNSEAFTEIIYSGYEKAEGTNLFYPLEIIMKSPLFSEYHPDGIYCIIKTKSLKVFKPGEIDQSAFIVTNVKKGKGKVPKEFTQHPDIYGEMSKQIKKEIIKSFKESIKESVKEEGKKMIKDGVKNIFKGLGGF